MNIQRFTLNPNISNFKKEGIELDKQLPKENIIHCINRHAPTELKVRYLYYEIRSEDKKLGLEPMDILHNCSTDYDDLYNTDQELNEYEEISYKYVNEMIEILEPKLE